MIICSWNWGGGVWELEWDTLRKIGKLTTKSCCECAIYRKWHLIMQSWDKVKWRKEFSGIECALHQKKGMCLLLLISMLWHRQAIFKSKGDKLCSSAECRIWTRGPRHQIASRLNARWQTDWAIEDQAKTWTRQPVPMISEHSAHLTPLSVDFRTWLWRYTCLLLLILMLWHRQAIFKSKGDKLCSSAECRIWTRGPRHQIASRLNARWQTDWAIEDQAKTWTRWNRVCIAPEERYVVISETFDYQSVIKNGWVIFIAEDYRWTWQFNDLECGRDFPHSHL